MSIGTCPFPGHQAVKTDKGEALEVVAANLQSAIGGDTAFDTTEAIDFSERVKPQPSIPGMLQRVGGQEHALRQPIPLVG